MAPSLSLSTSRSFKEVYVDVPPLSFQTFQPEQYATCSPTRPRKENISIITSNAGTPAKRKLSQFELHVVNIESEPPEKRLKDTPTYRCHQCSRAGNSDTVLCCTFIHANSKRMRCRCKYCISCLKNRYNEDLDQLKSIKREACDHVRDEAYTFQCPKCRDICNCRVCRKREGLTATGPVVGLPAKYSNKSISKPLSSTMVSPSTKLIPYVSLPPSKSGVTSSASSNAVIQTPHINSKGRSPTGKTVTSITNNAKASTSSVALVAATQQSSSASSSQPIKPKAPRKLHAKTLPIVKWTRLYTDLTFSEAMDRMFIREFVIRFAPSFPTTLAKSHLEELAHIAGLNEEEEMTPWVSDSCVKGVTLALLSVFGEETKHPAIKAAISSIRNKGANINRLWTVLSRMRESLEDSRVLMFPDPRGPPKEVLPIFRETRSSRDTPILDTVSIVESAQLVPVFVAIIEIVMRTRLIRDEIELGVKDGKETVREMREGIKKETERWDKERKKIMEAIAVDAKDASNHFTLQETRNAHKSTVLELEGALKVAMNAFAPRFAPLGIDGEGRTYYGMTPGQYDRDVALDVIETRKIDVKKYLKRPKRRDQTARESLKDWSWFIAVWGRRPTSSTQREPVIPKPDDEDGWESDDDESTDKWWIFNESEEIRKLAKWIGIKSELDNTLDHDISASASSKEKDNALALVKGLNDYATALDWRLSDSK